MKLPEVMTYLSMTTAGVWFAILTGLQSALKPASHPRSSRFYAMSFGVTVLKSTVRRSMWAVTFGGRSRMIEYVPARVPSFCNSRLVVAGKYVPTPPGVITFRIRSQRHKCTTLNILRKSAQG